MEDGGGALIASQTEECEGSIKIIKVLFPANMQAAHEQSLKALLRKGLHCDSPNGLFLFAKILPLSGDLAFLPPFYLCTFICDFFFSRHLQNVHLLGSFSSGGVSYSRLFVFGLCEMDLRCDTTELNGSLKLPG